MVPFFALPRTEKFVPAPARIFTLSPVQRMYCAKDALGVGAEEELCSLLCDSEAEIDEEEDDEELSGTKDERLSSLSDVRLSSVSGRCEEYGEELPEFCGLFVISLHQ